MAQYRYPGAQPFSTAQEHIFFGREGDMEALLRLIRLEPLVVLHAKSGLGKSSLLNAGIVPQFLKDGKYRPVNVRFNAYNPKSKEVQMPLETTREAIRTASESQNKPTFLEKLLPREDSLWYLLKKEQAHNGNQQQLLLLFDQFEELFTYPEEAILLFKMEMAEVLHTQIPQRFRQLVEQEVERPSHLDAEQLALLHEPFGTKVVMAIRSDRISLLDRIADYLPQVKRTWFELDALGRDQAEEAILNPAYKRGEFASPVFDYADEAIEKMLDFLTKEGTQKIESFQLQILCQAIERKVISGNLKQVSANDLGNIKKVYENYYEDQLRQITNPKEQLAAREFIEEGLIFEKDEIRISLYEGQIFQKFGISEALLRKLEDTHLIRREQMKGVYIYELSHDTLVAPVLKAKKERLAVQMAQQAEAERLQKERELEEVKQKAEQERELREQAEQAKAEAEMQRKEAEKQKIEAESQRSLAQQKEKQARQRTRVAMFVSIFALALAGLAFWFYQQSAANAVKALNAQVEAKRNENMALISADTARIAQQQAVDNLNLAVKREKEAKANLERAEKGETDAKQNYEAAQKARKEAEANLTKATKANASTVELLLENADRDVLNLRFEDALAKIKAAASLGALKEETARHYLEIAFWHGEAGNPDRAKNILDSAAMLVNKTATLKQPFRASIEAFDAAEYKKIMERYYYPVMVKVEGGTFDMGCNPGKTCEDLHKQEVSSFQMAKHETTWWQYYLFCKTTGHEYESPGWGTDGDNPAVNVSWFDAVLYLNWVNNQFSLDTFYIVENKREGDFGDYYDVTPNPAAKKGYRLPTEAEWEYAAKGGLRPDNTIYSGSNDPDEVAWHSINSGSRTRPVGKKKANALGIYDMSGNVWEWCWDWYGDYEPTPDKDYKGSKDSGLRVLRGGSWSFVADGCRSADRYRDYPDFGCYYFGFRLVSLP